MSTAALHDSTSQPGWAIVYDRPANRFIDGEPGEWHKYSSVQNVDGLQAYVLHDSATMVLVKTGQRITLNAPEPSPFFSFARYQAAPDQGSMWLFTVFGYLLPDYRVFVCVLPSHVEYHCEPRTTPFLVV